MNSSIKNDIYVQSIIEKQRILLETRNQDIINLNKKLIEYQSTIMDLQHAMGQYKKIAIAAAKPNHISQWINRSEPGLETK